MVSSQCLCQRETRHQERKFNPQEPEHRHFHQEENLKVLILPNSEEEALEFISRTWVKQVHQRKTKQAIAKKLLYLNKVHEGRPILDTNTVLTLFLEISDALQSSSKFYLHSIYESALLSENRKMMENLQVKLMAEVEEVLSQDLMPVPEEDVKYIQEKVSLEMNAEFLEKLNQHTPGKPALEVYYEMQTNLQELLSSRIKENDEMSHQLCKNHLDSTLGQIAEVESLSEEDLRNPLLMMNLEGLFTDLMAEYVEKAKGKSKCILETY